MISDERITTYINSLDKNDNPFLTELRKKADEDRVPIIRKEMESFIRVLFKLKEPKNILELGSAIGYSAILMSECISSDGKITTIENYDKRIIQARDNFKRAKKEDVITLLEGDALEIISKLDGEYDFIFMDAAKAQYINYLPHLIRLMKKGAILLTDNVLQDGDLFESRYGIIRRNRTIHTRMREYLEAVKSSNELETSIVQIGDGITLSVKL